MSMSVDAGSLKLVLFRLDGKKRGIKKASLIALDRMGKVLHARILENMSYNDHSLSGLAKLDHPYAKQRYGKIQIHQQKPYVIHKQGTKNSLNLTTALTGKLIKSRKTYEIKLDHRKVPYAKWVIYGTKVMFGRSVLWQTGDEKSTRRKMMKEAIKVIGAETRLKAGIRFT
jgi:hypothetical protein